MSSKGEKKLFYIIEQLTLCFQYLVCTSEYIKDWYFPVSELLEDRKHKSNVHNYTDQAVLQFYNMVEEQPILI